ncbi:hyaluronidase [Streptomyces antnestii]|uniref:Hyaluronidase n=1 Tax=Streptomyces antnestii TaxID=2494256 RepID=A0A3S3UFB0_9ACTN|nr:beta-N-acetylglucosaminidase domain-containing protein [Streptomyces sp. San01]RVU22912.1 hyaluronidase [Streptomyces sp. San01]
MTARRAAHACAVATLLVAASAAATPPVSADDAPALPVVSPTPQHMTRAGDDAPLPEHAELVVGDATDKPARDLVTATLRAHGVRDIDVRASASGHAPLTVLLGPATRADIADALHGTDVPTQDEGYAVRVGEHTVALGGTDATGQFYAAQTLKQLVRKGTIAGASVSDFPSMRLRGSIEGFYGPPWTAAERLDQMDFLGQVKSNTYVYAPKDDPYHRDKWREPYPADKLAQLGELVDRARANHVRFTFAVSPGGSVCYSDPADVKALTAKLQAMYDLGVRSFSVPLDDISYTKWNCAGDQTKFGAPGRGPAAKAQVGLLNTIQHDFIATHDGANPLQMVPTEYGDLTDTAYKQEIRGNLDKNVEVMWTGTDVVPPEITNDQAQKASELFGRKVFVWDNYPVNDFGRTSGRLLLAPYDKREPGLSGHLSGIVSNPMNQEAASKLAVFTMSDFSWNDRGYDRDRSARQSALHLAGGDPRVADAVQTFVDLNHMAPTFGSTPWQPQSPILSAELDKFWKAYDSDPKAAIRTFTPTATRIGRVPAVLRAGVPDQLFLHDAGPWLDSTDLWGKALGHGLAALKAIDAHDTDTAATERAAMDKAAYAASHITIDPAEHHQPGPVKIADPFLGNFVSKVQDLHDASMGLKPLRQLALNKTATQSSDYNWNGGYPFNASKSADGDRFNFSTTSGKEAQPWWQVDLGSVADLEHIDVYNRTDCCADRTKDYYVLVSDEPFTGSLADQLSKPGVWAHHETAQAGGPTVIPAQAHGRYVRVWLANDKPVELNMAEVEVYGRARA